MLFPKQSQTGSSSSCSFPSLSQGKCSQVGFPSPGPSCPLRVGRLHLVGHLKQHHLAPPPADHTLPEHLTSSHGNSFWKHLPDPSPPLLSAATPTDPGQTSLLRALSASPVSPFSLLFKMLLGPVTPCLPWPHTPFSFLPACPLLSSVSPCPTPCCNASVPCPNTPITFPSGPRSAPRPSLTFQPRAVSPSREPSRAALLSTCGYLNLKFN